MGYQMEKNKMYATLREALEKELDLKPCNRRFDGPEALIVFSGDEETINERFRSRIEDFEVDTCGRSISDEEIEGIVKRHYEGSDYDVHIGFFPLSKNELANNKKSLWINITNGSNTNEPIYVTVQDLDLVYKS